MLPYLLALDLDYTACDRTRHLSQRTRQALTAARAAGHTICFATGRRDIDMYPFWGRAPMPTTCCSTTAASCCAPRTGKFSLTSASTPQPPRC